MNIIRECFLLLSKRSDTVCNFLEGGVLLSVHWRGVAAPPTASCSLRETAAARTAS